MTGAETRYQRIPVPHHPHTTGGRARMATADSSPKLCECGCGQPTRIATQTYARIGHVRGVAIRFVNGGHAVRRPAPDRFWPKVDRRSDDECWQWMGGKTPAGYGTFRPSGRRRNGLAHRWSYEAANGPIPQGMQIDHLCRNRACVNPAHMEVVTLVENVLRGMSAAAVNARKTHCLRGHEYNEANTYWQKLYPGRRCRECDRIRAAKARRLAAELARRIAALPAVVTPDGDWRERLEGL